MAPYEVSSDDLDADFNGVSAHVIDGKVYYIDYGIMTGSVYCGRPRGSQTRIIQRPGMRCGKWRRS